MSEHRARVEWSRGGAAFTDNRYSRGHRWIFDGGVSVPASASPDVVPLPMSVASAVDPEEAFVAALASCHMLWFLSVAARRGFVVESYDDEAVGTLGRDSRRKTVITRVTLRPRTRFTGARLPTDGELRELHHEAHEECFLAGSVTSEVRCEPRS